MKYFYRLFMLCVCFVVILCYSNESCAATKKEKGVTYTYEIINAKQKTIKILKADNVPLEYEVPHKIGKYKVAKIGESAFAGCRIHMLKIAGISLKNIGRFAFANNEELQEVNFGKDYNKIYLGRDWFTDCPGTRIVIRPNVKKLTLKINANAGTLVIQGKNTKIVGAKKLDTDKYYIQFENIEIPSGFMQRHMLRKSYYGVVNDTSEDRYDSDSNNYSHSKLKKIRLKNTNTSRINIKQLILKETEKGQLRILNSKNKANIVWKSRDLSIASVNKRGLILAKKSGVTVITATIGKKNFKCCVKVYPNLTLSDISLKYRNEIFTRDFYADNLHRVTVHGDREKQITCRVTIKQIFAELSDLSLEKMTEKSDADKYLAMNFEGDSGERQVILYKNGNVGVKGKGVFQADRNIYDVVKGMLY